MRQTLKLVALQRRVEGLSREARIRRVRDLLIRFEHSGPVRRIRKRRWLNVVVEWFRTSSRIAPPKLPLPVAFRKESESRAHLASRSR